MNDYKATIHKILSKKHEMHFEVEATASLLQLMTEARISELDYLNNVELGEKWGKYGGINYWSLDEYGVAVLDLDKYTKDRKAELKEEKYE